MQALLIAADAVGGQARLAKLLGVSPPAVNQWVSGARPVPAERCPDIERLTGGAVRCEDLRPDVNWAVLRGEPALAPEPATEREGADV